MGRMNLRDFRNLSATVAQDLALGAHEEVRYEGGDLGERRRVMVRAGSVDALDRRESEEREANRSRARRVQSMPVESFDLGASGV